MRHISALRSQMESLQNRYNPEWDIAQGDPTVTYADEQLIDVVFSLIDMVEQLQHQVVLLSAERGDDNGYE